MKTFRNVVPFSICAIATMIIFAACSEGDGLVEPQDEPHRVISGLELLHNGKVIVLVDVDNENIYGTVNAQMAQNSDVFEVEFYDENGDVINNDYQAYKLAWRGDAEYAIFEQHEDLSEWEFHIHGKKSGDTAFQLLIENGKNEVYSSPSIPLKVKQ